MTPGAMARPTKRNELSDVAAAAADQGDRNRDAAGVDDQSCSEPGRPRSTGDGPTCSPVRARTWGRRPRTGPGPAHRARAAAGGGQQRTLRARVGSVALEDLADERPLPSPVEVVRARGDRPPDRGLAAALERAPTVEIGTSPGATRARTVSGHPTSATAVSRPPSWPASASRRCALRGANTGRTPRSTMACAASSPT
jgi:hypothetical protein